MMSYDTGFHNDIGKFPIFQCSALDATPSCKTGGFSSQIYMNRGQYCWFNVTFDPETNKSKFTKVLNSDQ